MLPEFQRQKHTVKLFSKQLWKDKKFTLNPADFQVSLDCFRTVSTHPAGSVSLFYSFRWNAVFAKIIGHGWLNISCCPPVPASNLNPVPVLSVCSDLHIWDRNNTDYCPCVTATHACMHDPCWTHVRGLDAARSNFYWQVHLIIILTAW